LGKVKGALLQSLIVNASTLISTTATSWEDVPDMSITLNTEAGSELQLLGNVNVSLRVGDPYLGTATAYLRLVVDGAQVGGVWLYRAPDNEVIPLTLMNKLEGLTSGSHTVKIQWYTDSGGTIYATDRSLWVMEWRPA